RITSATPTTGEGPRSTTGPGSATSRSGGTDTTARAASVMSPTWRASTTTAPSRCTSTTGAATTTSTSALSRPVGRVATCTSEIPDCWAGPPKPRSQLADYGAAHEVATTAPLPARQRVPKPDHPVQPGRITGLSARA